MANWSFGTQVPESSASMAADLLRAGDRFGAYEVLGSLGSGGSGQVLHARGPGGREVALKVLTGTLDGTRRERFRREGELAAGLDHSGIVRVLDGGEVGGVPFLVYELVEGGTDFQGRLALASLRGRVSMIARAAAALGHAHARGVVHRDLKPENLLVDQAGEVRVADFGLALASGAGRLTQTGEVVGTPLYMSPEQTLPGAPVGPQADVWALGVILYEAITGERPFGAERWLQLREEIQEARPVPPRLVFPGLPPELEAVCLRALAGAPGQRYPNGMALARDLEALLGRGLVPNAPGPALRVTRQKLETDSGPFPLGPLGRFELREVLGRGAMGIVYRALDPDLGREVALKFILSARGTKRLARFQREGEITASLNHPNILRVHNTGVLDEVPYLVYELVPGAHSLADAWKDADLRERVTLLRDAARGIGQAHKQGVTHRDLKPDNILVDQDGRVLVADFGLAAAQGLEKLTRTGAVVGTPNYMAPELISGERERVGPATDVWALGVMLFEMIMGRRPFTGSSFVELSVAITSGATPSLRGEGDSQFDRGLEAICAKALQKDTRDRYVDGEAFAADLDAWLGGGRVRASTASSLVPLVRRTWRWSLLAIPLVGSVAGLAFVLGGERPTPSEPPVRVQPAEQPTAPEGPSEEWLAEGRKGWRAVKGMGAGAEQLTAARAWLADHAEHPLAEEAQQLVETLRFAYPVVVLKHAPGAEVHVAFQTNHRLVAAGEDGSLSRWDLDEEREIDRIELPSPPGQTIQPLVALDEERVVGGRVLTLWWIDFARRTRRALEGIAVESMALSPDRKVLAVGTIRSRRSAGTWEGPCVILFDAEREVEIGRLGGFRAPITALTFFPDGGLLCFSGAKNQIGLPEECYVCWWDGHSQAPRYRRSLRTLVRSVSLSSQGMVAAGTLTGELLIFDPESGEITGEFVAPGEGGELISSTAHGGTLKGLAFSPDGTRLHSVSQGRSGFANQIRVWDVATRTELRPVTMTQGLNRNESFALSPDGKRLAVGSKQGTVELWAAE